jgi:hypothetical protein
MDSMKIEDYEEAKKPPITKKMVSNKWLVSFSDIESFTIFKNETNA